MKYGCYLPFSSNCDKTAPTAALEMSVTTKNGLLKSGYANTGVVVSASFNTSNDFCIGGVQLLCVFSRRVIVG